MLRPCRICSHEARQEIDAAILNNASYKTLAERFQISMLSILTHRHHLASIPAQALPVQQPNVETLLNQMRDLHEQCLALVEAAEASSEPLRIGVALGQIRRRLKPLGEMTEQLRKDVRKLRSRDAALEHDASA